MAARTLITGATKRLGLAMAQACLQKGDRVIAHRRATTRPIPPDLQGVAEDWVWEMEGNWNELPPGRIDHLILNASLFQRGASWCDLTTAEAAQREADNLQRHLQVNVLAGWRLCTALAARGGLTSVVVVLDTYLEQPFPEFGAYMLSRAAGVGLVHALASELAPIRVNAVAPGTVLPSEAAPEYRAEREPEIVNRTLLRRMGTPADVVQAVLYLRDAPYVTGQILRIDGGRSKL